MSDSGLSRQASLLDHATGDAPPLLHSRLRVDGTQPCLSVVSLDPHLCGFCDAKTHASLHRMLRRAQSLDLKLVAVRDGGEGCGCLDGLDSLGSAELRFPTT